MAARKCKPVSESISDIDPIGDRIIQATQRWQRSSRRQRLRRDLYTVDGLELSLSQVDALELVARGALRMHELADRLDIDPSTATRTVAPLADSGLVERLPDPGNRRFVLLRCSQKGAEVASRITAGRRELMHQVLAPMDGDRRLLLAELLEEFLRLTDDYGAELESEEVAG